MTRRNEPRKWFLKFPPPPPTTVQTLRCALFGYLWTRSAGDTHWETADGPLPVLRVSWEGLLFTYGPVTDATLIAKEEV